jgi:hypothetical protein
MGWLFLGDESLDGQGNPEGIILVTMVVTLHAFRTACYRNFEGRGQVPRLPFRVGSGTVRAVGKPPPTPVVKT